MDLIRSEADPEKTYTIMEVCGGHTITLFRYGIRSMLPDNVHLLSGPGCPVCVTSMEFIDHVIELSKRDDVIIASFGDLIRVPGSRSSLQKERTECADVRVCYSPLDALVIAKDNPEKKVVFPGIGFETTAPTIASTIKRASEKGLKNFYVLSAHKTMPGAMKSLVEGGELALDAFLCPGHVSAITGTHIYDFLAADYGKPCVVSGFEPVDMLQSILMIIRQMNEGRSVVENQYNRGVKQDGNSIAQDLLAEVFTPGDVEWRGLGVIPGSALFISEKYSDFDAAKVLPVDLPPVRENPGCICGDIMRGVKIPYDCKLFGKACIPENPSGSCMVSDEGTCATYYRYAKVKI